MSQCLLLGLGGTGSRIINYVAADLKKRNIEINKGKISCAVIDTNKSDQEDIAELGTGIPVVATSKDRSIGAYLKRYAKDGVNDWMPSSIQLDKVGMLDGASQMRPKSRLAFFDTSRDAYAMKDLVGAIDKLFEDRERGEVRVMIVSSLAGGTGSGMFIQTALWVRKYFEERNCPVTIRGILVLPDVFIRTVSQIGRDERECKILRANAYGAIRELNAISKLKTKRNAPKPASPIKLDDLFDSSKPESVDGQPVFDFAFFMDDIAYSGSALNSIVDYEKTVARLVYMQLFAPMQQDMNSEEDNYFRVSQKEPEPLYGACGTAKAAYPADSVLEYCSLRAAKEALATGWRKIDQKIQRTLELEKAEEEDGSERTNPYMEYIRLFDELSQNNGGEDKLLYRIRDDIKNVTVEFDGSEKGKTEKTNKIDDFTEAFEAKITALINTKDPGGLSQIKINESKEKWVADETSLKTVANMKAFVTGKREEVENFVASVGANGKRLANSLANTVFPVDMGEVDRKDITSIIGMFTKTDENGKAYFIHPLAVRYLLYKLKFYFEEKRKCGSELEGIRKVLVKNPATQKYEAEIEAFDKEKTEEEEDAITYLDKRAFLETEGRLVKKHKDLYFDFNEEQAKFCALYAEKFLTSHIATTLAERTNELIKIIESFFNSLDDINTNIDSQIADNINTTEDKGQKVFYVCASKEEKEGLYDSLNLRTDNNNTDINKIIVDSLYAKLCVKQNPEAAYNKPYASMNVVEIFKNEVIKTYSEIINSDYGDKVHLDLYTAVCKSSDLEYKKKHGMVEDDTTAKKLRHERAMREIIDKLINGSSPFLLYRDIDDEERKKEMRFWGFNPELAKACKLGQMLGINEESQQNVAYDKSELDCYSAVYGIRAGDVEKFNEKYVDNHNNYYRSYKMVVDEMTAAVAEGDAEALVQTPHLDKTWHTILPYITSDMENNSQNEFYRLFWLALAYGKITVDKKGNYVVERTKQGATGTYPEEENLKYNGKNIARPEVNKLVEALEKDASFLKDAKECEAEFNDECDSIINYEDTKFLRGENSGTSSVNEDGEKIKDKVGGVASITDTNALTILVRFVSNGGNNTVAVDLVETLFNLCKEMVGFKYKDNSGDKDEKIIEVVYNKFCKSIYDTCQMSNKDIEQIKSWRKAWDKDKK